MAAKCVHAATRSANVAEQELNHSGGAYDLRSKSMLRPAHRINDRRGFLHVAIFAYRSKQIDGPQVLVPGDARNPFDGFGGVAGILLLHQLEDAARMLKGEV